MAWLPLSLSTTSVHQAAAAASTVAAAAAATIAAATAAGHVHIFLCWSSFSGLKQ